MIIKLPLRFEGSKGEKILYALFDSGATFSCIHPDKVADLETVLELYRPMEVATASEGNYIKITEATRLDFYLDDVRLSDEFMLVPSLSEEAIIGANTMQKWRLKLDFEHDIVIVDPKVAKLILKNLI
jgi:predicted aspartyl protease